MAVETPTVGQLAIFLKETTLMAREQKVNLTDEQRWNILARAILLRYMTPDGQEPLLRSTRADTLKRTRAKKKLDLARALQEKAKRDAEDELQSAGVE